MCLGKNDNCKHVNNKEVSNYLENDTTMDNKCRDFRLPLILLDYSTPQNSNHTAKVCPKIHSTLSIMKKPYTEILLHYRQLFIKGKIIICEWGIFGVE